MGLKVEIKKTVTPIGQVRGKGLMIGPVLVTGKPPILLREDSKYALEKLLSFITANNYEDLSNHATETTGETGLFSIALVVVSVPFLFFFPSTFLLTNPLLLPSDANDEGIDGSLPEPQDCVRPY